MSAVPSQRDIIERRQRLGFVSSAPVIRMDLIRPVVAEPVPAPVVVPLPKPERPKPSAYERAVDEWIGQADAVVLRPAPSRAVLEAVEKHFGFARHDLFGTNREAPLILARQTTCWLLRKHTDLSFPVIGRMLGGRDHSTILHACRKIEARRARGGTFADALDNLSSEIERRLSA